jgi:hypothetical protein
MPRVVLMFATLTLLCGFAYAQDDQSLGDLARQVRAQKQQKAGQGKDTAKSLTASSDATEPKTARALTNDDVPDHSNDKSVSSSHSDSKKSESGDSKDSNPSDSATNPADREAQAETWKSQIQTQKSNIEQLQQQIADVSSSIQYAGANCVSNCEQWNEHQRHKQEQVETMKSQLEQLQHQLEEMQESARKQGFGSSVYEP